MKLALALLILSIATTPALADQPADPAPTEESNRELAKKHANQAKTDYKLGRWQAALDGYTKAYELVPIPGLLFNIAQCHKGLKNYERAVYFYEGEVQYLGENYQEMGFFHQATLLFEINAEAFPESKAALPPVVPLKSW